MHPTLTHYLVVGAVLFGLGLFTVATRKSAVGMLLGVELILNSAALNFVAFEHFTAEARSSGQVFAIFIVAFAASEAAVALAIVLQVYRTHRSIAADELTELRR
ncbi:MAG TPA: NADH-quinone oxidoreductase subunit NuoK [Polyangiaceae bacterium]|jgi:NADH-quinone oxidoreductase subunit K